MNTVDLDQDGPAAPPRINGELVFEAPWQSRVFGLTAGLVEQGHLDWDDFRVTLIDEINDAESQPDSFSYWQCWLRALTTVTSQRGLLSTSAIDDLSGRLAERPDGHDH